ncbi:MAG: hypothetical protein JWO81_3520 [Alphaproteobacteria bacterium]|nr:hypothetical protein [Alphaproteobacteria bacterium]
MVSSQADRFSVYVARTMERLFSVDVLDPPAVSEPSHGVAKSHGVHYTPVGLADFLARRVVAHLGGQETVILDPACGDGGLLLAVAAAIEQTGLPAPQLVGVDRDPDAIAAAEMMLSGARATGIELRCGDFLDMADGHAGLPMAYNAIISNPPYVRTQVLGAARAQALALQFGLTGRVDLYHAFVAAMTAKLTTGGILGLLCSNRFMTTKGGHSLRSLLLSNYNIAEVWDLGDTKLFDAAVLPAVLLGRKTAESNGAEGQFVRVYAEEGSAPAPESSTLLGALEDGHDGPVRVEDRRFNIERGSLIETDPERPWRLTSPSGSRWLAEVARRSAGRLGDLGPIRVGIKTTADSVYIRQSWDDLPEELRPEEGLLRPLLTHHVADRWQARTSLAKERFVLYTHETRDGRRQAIDVSRFPRALKYLEQHRERLEGRDYVRKARREWFEIWVPQQPADWAAPKLVWPDISEDPRFFLDETGSIVNGDCYWLTCPEQSAEQIALALAVANSSFALRYYDMCCGNRLYAGRRRFITQYLEELPIPNVSASELSDITGMVEELRRPDNHGTPSAVALDAALDAAIAGLFGMEEIER